MRSFLHAVLCLLVVGGCSPSKGSLRSPAAPMPEPDSLVQTVALGSCADQAGSQKHWGIIGQEKPDLFVFMGDNVYGDIDRNTGEMTILENAYLQLGAHPEYDQFQATIPILPTWDDHDYGANDAGGEFPQRTLAEDLFMKFWSVPSNDPRRSRPGVHHHWAFGPEGKRLQIIVLDTRMFRGKLRVTDNRGEKGKERYLENPDPNQSMLGAAQWEWLEGTLSEPADVRLVVSSVQALATDHGFECWRLLPHERERLIRSIAQASGTTILLSGDRHIGGIYKEEVGSYGDLVELTSSSLNKAFGASVEELGPPMVGNTVVSENYGWVRIDWEKQQIHLELRDMSSTTVHSLALPFRR